MSTTPTSRRYSVPGLCSWCGARTRNRANFTCGFFDCRKEEALFQLGQGTPAKQPAARVLPPDRGSMGTHKRNRLPEDEENPRSYGNRH